MAALSTDMVGMPPLIMMGQHTVGILPAAFDCYHHASTCLNQPVCFEVLPLQKY